MNEIGRRVVAAAVCCSEGRLLGKAVGEGLVRVRVRVSLDRITCG